MDNTDIVPTNPDPFARAPNAAQLLSA